MPDNINKRKAPGVSQPSTPLARTNKRKAPKSISTPAIGTKKQVTGVKVISIMPPQVPRLDDEKNNPGGPRILRLDDYVVSFTNSMVDDKHEGESNSAAKLGGFQSARSMIKTEGKAEPKKIRKQNKEKGEEGAFAMRLDEAQEQITKMDINKPLLIVAGAGSGKTTTLCARVIEMMRQGVAAQQILVITFTNKAAGELKERIARYMAAHGMDTTDRAMVPFASTFHSWCYGLVMRNHRVLGWRKCPMVVAAESEHLAILHIALRQINSVRRLRQCEDILGIAAQESDAERRLLWADGADERWMRVVELTTARTGFSVAAMVDQEDAKPRGRKFGAKAQQQAQQRVATDAVYAHLYAHSGKACGLPDIDSEASDVKYGAVFAGKDLPKAMMQFVYRAKACGDTPDMFPDVEASVLAAYNGTLRKFDLVDFDDLLASANAVLESDDVLRSVRQQFPYLLVDEFQDLNRLQMRLVLRLQSGVGRVTAVGDERQSIFAFRGASCEHNFAEFLAAFVDANVGKTAAAQDKGAGAMASLTRNYRSHQSIVDLGNIVARDTGRGSPLLARLRVPLTAQPSALVVPVNVWANADAHLEADRIVRRIAYLLRSGDCAPSDIAVISRCLNFGSYRPTGRIEQELLRAGIPFVVRGGASALKSPRMQTMMALVRVVANPADDVACDVCLRDLVKDIGPIAVKKIHAFDALRMPPLPAFERLVGVSKAQLLAKNARASLASFVDSVQRWQAEAEAGKATLRELVRSMYDAYVADAEDDTVPVGQPKQGVRPVDRLWGMLDAIVDSLRATPGALPLPASEDDTSFASAVDIDGPCSLMLVRAFSSQLCMLSSSAEDKGQQTAPLRPSPLLPHRGAVVITTVHQAKGLEWEHVFVPHFNENLFPMGFRGPTHADMARSTTSSVVRLEHEAQHFREEGRLAYVAITRAKHGLYISSLGRYPEFWMERFLGGQCTPSRYLPDIMQAPRKETYNQSRKLGMESIESLMFR
ncbi:hypothetical protein LPJ66_004562 [Kickxella alabastrina]|uniref:Uncharacterized protein n=1 Tax=Kickxella alabastrina TaxID=61397 RepID=A0ACC1INN3_9FUNG|nr:hypothetical protein LPJ66_004562 [Kickxella alabastrina]